MVNMTLRWEDELTRWPGDRKSSSPMAERFAPGDYDQASDGLVTQAR